MSSTMSGAGTPVSVSSTRDPTLKATAPPLPSAGVRSPMNVTSRTTTPPGANSASRPKMYPRANTPAAVGKDRCPPPVRPSPGTSSQNATPYVTQLANVSVALSATAASGSARNWSARPTRAANRRATRSQARMPIVPTAMSAATANRSGEAAPGVARAARTERAIQPGCGASATCSEVNSRQLAANVRHTIATTTPAMTSCASHTSQRRRLAMPGLFQRRPINRFEPFGYDGGIETAPQGGSGRDRKTTVLGAFGEVGNSVRQLARILGGHEPAGARRWHDVRHAAAILGGHHGNAEQQRFHGSETKSLTHGRKREHIGIAYRFLQPVGRHSAEKAGVGTDPQLHRLALERAPFRTIAHHCERQRLSIPAQIRHGLEQEIDALLLGETADGHNAATAAADVSE